MHEKRRFAIGKAGGNTQGFTGVWRQIETPGEGFIAQILPVSGFRKGSRVEPGTARVPEERGEAALHSGGSPVKLGRSILFSQKGSEPGTDDVEVAISGSLEELEGPDYGHKKGRCRIYGLKGVV